MWEHDKTDFLSLFCDSDLEMNDPNFTKLLNELGLENEISEINFYLPQYVSQINLKPNVFLGQSLDTFWLGLDPSSIFKSTRITVDKHVLNECSKLCKKYAFEGHEEKLACIIKFGYTFYAFSAYLSKQQEEKIQALKELKMLSELAFSGEELFEINFKGNETGEVVRLKSKLMKHFVTNGVAKLLFENIHKGWLNVLSIDSITLTEWNIRYRNIYLFMLVCYLYREAHFIKVEFNENNTINKVHFTDDVINVLIRLFEIAKVDLKATKKKDRINSFEASDSARIRSIWKSVLKEYPYFEKFLYDGEYTDEEYLNLEDSLFEEGDKIKSDLLDRFLNKKGLGY